MFESTFEKCLIQLSVELIQLDIVYDSLNYTECWVESALPRVKSKIFRKLIQTSENIWIWGLFSFSVANIFCLSTVQFFIFNFKFTFSMLKTLPMHWQKASSQIIIRC